MSNPYLFVRDRWLQNVEASHERKKYKKKEKQEEKRNEGGKNSEMLMNG